MTALFVGASAVAVAGALGVVAAPTPVHGVLAMLVNFAGLAALLLSLQAEFLAVAQIIVYAGAVMVLFLFVISLLSARNRPVEGPRERLYLQLPLGAATVGALVAGVWMSAVGPAWPAAGTVRPWVPAPEGFGSVEHFGRAVLAEFPFELEVAGLVLLVALVGVMVLVGRRPEPAAQARVPEAGAVAVDGRVGSDRAGHEVVVAVAAGEERR